MSRMTPPPPSPASPSPNDPNRRPVGLNQPAPAPGPTPQKPGMPAQKPNVTTPKAPELGASGPPTATPKPVAPKPAVPGGAAPKLPGHVGPGSLSGPSAAAPSGPLSVEELKARPLGRILTKLGKVTREQVVEALNFQKSKGGALGRILIDLGYVKEADVNYALAAQLGYEFVNLEGKQITPEMIKAVPSQIATTQKVLPIAFDPAGKKLTIAMANHENFRAIDDLRSLMGYDVKAVLAEPELLEKLINKHYQAAAEDLTDILNEMSNDSALKD